MDESLVFNYDDPRHNLTFYELLRFLLSPTGGKVTHFDPVNFRDSTRALKTEKIFKHPFNHSSPKEGGRVGKKRERESF